jgi:hypothetical protein
MPTRKEDEKQDRAVEDSFPASDPPANSGIVGPRVAPPGRGRAPRQRDDDSRANNTPPHERPAAETAGPDRHEEQPRK